MVGQKGTRIHNGRYFFDLVRGGGESGKGRGGNPPNLYLPKHLQENKFTSDLSSYLPIYSESGSPQISRGSPLMEKHKMPCGDRGTQNARCSWGSHKTLRRVQKRR